jgi:glucans biosynthesis protein C
MPADTLSILMAKGWKLMNSEQPVSSGQRLHGLDAVRGFALLLGVALHASMSFLPGPQVWVVADADRTPLLSVLFYVLHMFRMLTFFLIAGFFAHMGVHRLGLKAFALDRLKRIALPLVVAWPLVLTSITAILIWNVWIAYGGKLPTDGPPQPPLSLDYFPLAHLWFLYVLLLLYIITLIVRAGLNLVARGWLPGVMDGFVRIVTGWGGAVLVALPMTVALYLHPNWLAWFGVPTPDMTLKPNLAALVTYGVAFGFGWLLHRQPDLLRRLEHRWAYHLVVAIACTVWSLILVGGVVPVLTPAPQDTPKLVMAGVYSLGAWSWSFAVIGLALRFLSDFNPTRRYIADASYWVYLVHLPLVMAFQTLTARLEWSWVLKFPLVVVTTLFVAFSSYHLFVRFTAIGGVLNGRRALRDPKVTRTNTGTAT